MSNHLCKEKGRTSSHHTEQVPPLFVWYSGSLCNTTVQPTPSTGGAANVSCPYVTQGTVTWLSQVRVCVFSGVQPSSFDLAPLLDALQLGSMSSFVILVSSSSSATATQTQSASSPATPTATTSPTASPSSSSTSIASQSSFISLSGTCTSTSTESSTSLASLAGSSSLSTSASSTASVSSRPIAVSPSPHSSSQPIPNLTSSHSATSSAGQPTPSTSVSSTMSASLPSGNTTGGAGVPRDASLSPGGVNPSVIGGVAAGVVVVVVAACTVLLYRSGRCKQQGLLKSAPSTARINADRATVTRPQVSTEHGQSNPLHAVRGVGGDSAHSQASDRSSPPQRSTPRMSESVILRTVAGVAAMDTNESTRHVPSQPYKTFQVGVV